MFAYQRLALILLLVLSALLVGCDLVEDDDSNGDDEAPG